MIAERKPANSASTNAQIKPKRKYAKRRTPAGPGRPFKKGWKGGPGNPHADKVAKLRSAVLNAVTPEDFKLIARRFVADALAGNTHSGEAIMDRTIGKTTPEERGSTLADALKILAEVQARHEGEDL